MEACWFSQEEVEVFLTHPNAWLRLVLSKVSFPVNWSAARRKGESRWAGAGRPTWLGNGPNVPYSAYPASQMDDDEVNGGVELSAFPQGVGRKKTLWYRLHPEVRKEG